MTSSKGRRHEHTCPFCGLRWAHNGPNCNKQEDYPCFDCWLTEHLLPSSVSER
jgi:hypothetical protein